MIKTQDFIVDFVARGNSESEWLMVLVEEGPLSGAIDSFLSHLQNRLYNTIDAAIDGQLAKKFPETKGKKIVIRLDCYDLPEVEVREFFSAFSAGALEADDYKKALSNNKFLNCINFEVNFDSTK